MSLVPNIKYKTEYCLYWQEGKICEKGNYCFFAHGEQELRTIEENHQDIRSRNSLEGLMQAKPHNYKTVFCKFYAEGQCKLGDKCTYAHQRREKRKNRGSQEFKIQSQITPQNWSLAQNYDLYSQYYYQQLYQNYSHSSFFYPQLQVEMLPGDFQNMNEFGQISGKKVEDISIYGQANKAFTYINQIQIEKISQNFQSPQSQSKLSPNTTKTQSPVKDIVLDVKQQKEFSKKHQI